MYSLHLLTAFGLSGFLCHVTAGIHRPHAASLVFSPCLCGSPATVPEQCLLANACWDWIWLIEFAHFIWGNSSAYWEIWMLAYDTLMSVYTKYEATCCHEATSGDSRKSLHLTKKWSSTLPAIKQQLIIFILYYTTVLFVQDITCQLVSFRGFCYLWTEPG